MGRIGRIGLMGRIDDSDSGEDSRQERVGLRGDEINLAITRGIFQGFKKSVLGG